MTDVTPALDVTERAALDSARSRWTALGMQNYAFDIRQGCLCPPDKQTWRHIEVADGHIVSVIPEGTTSTTLQRITEPGWWTIDELYVEILRRADEPGNLTISYDAALGFPSYVLQSETLPDAGGVIEVKNLTPR